MKMRVGYTLELQYIETQLGNYTSTYIFFKVLQAEFIGFGEKLRPVHVAGVQNDICALWYPEAIYDVIGQGSTHGEVHHRVKPQAFVDEALQHLQLLKVPVLKLSFTYSETMRYQYCYNSLKVSKSDHYNMMKGGGCLLKCIFDVKQIR